jgi:CheY-like chemotaxis protein
LARKILLADDSVTAQNMGRKILTDAGYEVVTVNNGSAALKKITDERPAVIVLDVYMPGYSGLEVCQRVKDGKDTAGIPVLLTVGKLEPFKQDDARKVHADAFIIKPFEATELLAALSRLESRLESTGDSEKADSAKSGSTKSDAGKKGRASVATMERYERLVADGAPQFGDHESGWKARLPQPTARAHDESEAETSYASSSGQSQRISEIENAAPAFAPADFPKDATSAELAAIAAAAAAVGQGAASAHELDRNSSYPPIEAESPRIETAETSSESQVHEVAATQSVAPAVMEKPAMNEPDPVTVAAAPVATSSRWVAEEVPVEARESELVLEREMQKAFAAFAAAESHSSYEPGPGGQAMEQPIATMAPPPVGSPTPFTTVSSEREPVIEMRSEAVAPTPCNGTHSSELPKPPSVSFTPPPVTMDEANHAISAFGNPHPFGTTEERHDELVIEPEPRSETLEVAREPEQPNRFTEIRSEPVAMAEKPATWADWHDIREAETQSASSATADSDLEQLKAAKGFTPETEKQIESAMAATASGDSSSTGSDANLSSIVDSMLAELKPKLMAELAKKLEKK